MNLEQLRAALKTAQEALRERTTQLETAQRAIDEADESADLEALRTTFDQAAAAFDEAAGEVDRCRTNLTDGERRQRIIDDNPVPVQPGAPARERGSRHESVYRRDGRHSFFADAFRFQRMHDPAARERLESHGREMEEVLRDRQIELRDVGTGAFAGLTIPQFLVDLFAPLARAGRPFANSVRSLRLPDSGMVISISRITTGSAAAVQATENAAVQETNIDDTKLDVDVRTIAGMQDVSRQALERSEMVDEVVFADLVADYHTKLNASVLNDDGTAGTHLGVRSVAGINAVTYTDATPTVGEIYAKLADAIQQIDSGLFRPPSAIWMHPRRWGWFVAALDSQNRPLVVPVAPQNPVGVGDANGYGQVVGSVLGLPVITDANLPTTLGAGVNEDVILVGRADDFLLWEEGDGMPRQVRFEETLGGNLTVKLVVYGYSAFTAGRYPEAAATIGGTGLVAPTF